MRVVVQRVKSANCVVEGQIISKINHGYLLLVGFTMGDNSETLKKMARKIANLRVFEDEAGKMNLSIKEIKGEILSISQFTLYADTSKGNRPSFIQSMEPEAANRLYKEFNQVLMDDYEIKTLSGIFGANMELNPVCVGPVTIMIEM